MRDSDGHLANGDRYAISSFIEGKPRVARLLAASAISIPAMLLLYLFGLVVAWGLTFGAIAVFGNECGPGCGRGWILVFVIWGVQLVALVVGVYIILWRGSRRLKNWVLRKAHEIESHQESNIAFRRPILTHAIALLIVALPAYYAAFVVYLASRGIVASVIAAAMCQASCTNAQNQLAAEYSQWSYWIILAVLAGFATRYLFRVVRT